MHFYNCFNKKATITKTIKPGSRYSTCGWVRALRWAGKVHRLSTNYVSSLEPTFLILDLKILVPCIPNRREDNTWHVKHAPHICLSVNSCWTLVALNFWWVKPTHLKTWKFQETWAYKHVHVIVYMRVPWPIRPLLEKHYFSCSCECPEILWTVPHSRHVKT